MASPQLDGGEGDLGGYCAEGHAPHHTEYF